MIFFHNFVLNITLFNMASVSNNLVTTSLKLGILHWCIRPLFMYVGMVRWRYYQLLKC